MGGGRQQNVTRRSVVRPNGPIPQEQFGHLPRPAASVRSVPTGGKAQGLPRRRGPMAAGSRAMGRGRGHPQPGTAAFPNLAGAEDGTLPFSHCSSAVGIQNWGAKGQGRVAISMVRGSVGALRGDRKGGHLGLVSTVILPAGEGTHLRVRAGWDLKTFLLLTWRCGPSPLLSSSHGTIESH